MLGSLLITPFADRFGRKPIIVVGIGLTNASLLIIGLVHDLNARYVGTFVIGLAASPRLGNAYILMLESIPEKYRSWVGSIQQSFESLTLIWATIYFRYISKDWQYWIYFVIGYAFLVSSTVLGLLESTKFLASRRRFGEARRTLEKIAQRNRV